MNQEDIIPSSMQGVMNAAGQGVRSVAGQGVRNVAAQEVNDDRIGAGLECMTQDNISGIRKTNPKSWQWTNTKLVPQLLHVLDSCAVEIAAVAIIVLLGQLGRCCSIVI